MTSQNQISSLFIGFAKKAITYEGGAFTVISVSTVSLTKVIEALFLDITLKQAILPLLAYGLLMIFFVLIAVGDFYTGIKASKKKHYDETGNRKGYMRSDMLWSSIWKFLAVCFISTALTGFCYLFLIAGINFLYQAFLMGLIAFYFVVISFEIHSIGENQKSRYGKKPKFYEFIDRVAETVREGIIERVKSTIKNKRW